MTDDKGYKIATKYWDVTKHLADDRIQLLADEQIQAAGTLLQQGGTVAFPTETVYGLGADARNTAAVDTVFKAKGRPSDNPLIVHIAHRDQLEELVLEVPPLASALMDAYWPGPLTIVLPIREGVLSPRVTAGLNTVGIRMPDHPVALAIIEAADCPIAAPSANVSGRPSPTLASHVREDLDGRIGAIVDGGPAGVGVESTVVRVLDTGSIQVLRPGGITDKQIKDVTGAKIVSGSSAESEARVAMKPQNNSQLEETDTEALPLVGQQPDKLVPLSPGIKYTHYAPQGELSIVKGDSPDKVAAWIEQALLREAERGAVTGLLAFEEHLDLYHQPAGSVISLGSLAHLDEAARILYAALRRFDETGATFMLAEACEEDGIGVAVMNRLVKAAGGRIITIE